MSEARAKVDSIEIGSCVLVAVLVFLFHLPFAQNTRLFDDSADYARASEAAFVPTWLNTNSTSLSSNRACLEGILWVLRTGAPWRFLPASIRRRPLAGAG
jgi:hypothetical protein